MEQITLPLAITLQRIVHINLHIWMS